jgi:hypothetical protein
MGKARFEASESEEMRKITPTSAALDEKTSSAALVESSVFQTCRLLVERENANGAAFDRGPRSRKPARPVASRTFGTALALRT